MAHKYAFRDSAKLHFVSFATINWIDVPGGVYFLSVTGPTGTRYSTKLVRIGSYW